MTSASRFPVYTVKRERSDVGRVTLRAGVRTGADVT